MHRSTIRKIIITLVALALIALPLFFPNPNGPTGMQWLVAMIEGRGTPHYPVSGTAESNLEAFLNRNPALRPHWNEIPDEENGLFQALQLIKDGKVLDPVFRDPLREFKTGQNWDHATATSFLDSHLDLLDEIRRIGQLEHRSASALPVPDLIMGDYELARGFKNMSDLLLQSIKVRFHQRDQTGALQDFQSIFALAAHLDQHEVPCLYYTTISLLLRLSAQDVLRKTLPDLTPGSDLSGYLHALENLPDHEQEIASLLRGEAVWGMAMWFADKTSSDEKNPIWNVEAFTDAFAERMLEAAEFCEKTGTFTSADFAILDGILTSYPADLEKAALEKLRENAGLSDWMRGYKRVAYLTAHTLAALQLHEIERTTGPVTATNDPRLRTLATEPFTGLPFHFDPATRQLTPDPASTLATEPDETRIIQLPPSPSQSTDY